MTQSNKLCNHCIVCDCPEIEAEANVDYCKKSSETYTLIHLTMGFFSKDTSPSRDACSYQARVKILGSDDNVSEQSVIKFENENVPSSCEQDDEKYSFIYNFKFEWEDNELDTFNKCIKNLFAKGAYDNIKIEVEVFSLVEGSESASSSIITEEQTSFECNSYGLTYIDCETNSDSSTESDNEPCTCKWDSDESYTSLGQRINYSDVWWIESSEYSEGEPGGGRNNLCRFPPCFPCGHLPLAKAGNTMYEELEDGVTHNKLEVLFDTTLSSAIEHGMLVNVNIEIYSSDMTTKIAEIENFDFVSINSTWNNLSNYEADSYTDGKVILDLTGKVNYSEYGDEILHIKLVPNDACECECLFGRKRAGEDVYPYNEYNFENSINNDLIESSNNYHNMEFTIGNCVKEIEDPVESAAEEGTTSDTDPPSISDLKYWIRYRIPLSNILANKFGHNCDYTGVTLNLYSNGVNVYSIDLTENLSDNKVNLVRDLENEDVIESRERTHAVVLNETRIITDEIDDELKSFLNSYSDVPLNPELYYAELCITSGNTSSEDGYSSETGSTYNYQGCDFCCQKFTFTNLCVDNPGECIPCPIDDKVSCQFESRVSSKYSLAELITNVNGPLLSNINFEVNGVSQEFLVAAADGEETEYRCWFDVVPGTRETVKICCSDPDGDSEDS